MKTTEQFNKIEIGRRVAACLEKLFMTQRELAAKVGVTTGCISHCVSGRRLPSAFMLNKIAKALEVSPGWLTYGELTTKLDEIPGKINVIIVPCLTAKQIDSWIANPVIQGDHKAMYFPDYNDLSKSAFSFEITGSMMADERTPEKGLIAGDIAIIDPVSDTPLKSGDFVMAKFGAEDFRLRQYQQDGQVTFLTGIDSRLPTIPLTEDIELIGAIVYTIPKPQLRK